MSSGKNWVNFLDHHDIYIFYLKAINALTAKLIEVEPYKWIQVIDEGKRKIEQELMKMPYLGH